MPQLMERYLENEKERERIKKKMIEDTEYIDWLEEFSENNPHFTSDLQSEGNTDNIRNLDLLYEIIDAYARKNYIRPHKTKWGYFYILEYKGSLYKIGCSNREYEFYYCNKISETNREAISFEDVIKGRVSEEADLINLKLEKLNALLSELSAVLTEEEVQRQVTQVYKSARVYKKINGSH